LSRCKFTNASEEPDAGARSRPNLPMIKIFRAAVWYYQGKKDEAIDAIAKVLKENPRMDGIKPLHAEFLAGAGRKEEALAQLTPDALAISRADHDMAYWVASTYALVGDKDLAFKWLNKAVRLGNENKPHFVVDANLDILKDDPRWQELLDKMGNDD